MQVASAQQHTMNFLTYANTDLGFTMKSDWKSTVTKGSGGSNYVVFIQH